MTTIEKVKTDVAGFDTLTYGGLPRGRSTLITGRSGTAKSVLGLEIACNLGKRGVKTVLLTIEEREEDLLTTASTLGFELPRLIAEGMVHVLDLTRNLEGPVVLSGNFDVAGLIHAVETAVREHGAQALVLDSATALFSPRPAVEVMRSLFYQLVSAFHRLGLTSVITAEAEEEYGRLTTLGVEDFICDLVVILRNLIDGERRRRSLEVHKYRRSRHYKGEYPFSITNKGIIVFPLDTSPDFDPQLDIGRFSSGVTGLDEMTCGGWRRDSIVLVRGPTGSGKTTLAGLYARAGAERGEKVIYYGFEETKNILMRNFASMGMPLEGYEASGNLVVTCSYPEATSPEDLLIDVRAGIETHNPSLIVFDSISSIEHSTSERGFRQFIVGLSALIREHSRSALLVQTVAIGPQRDATTPFLSTIPDAIVLLDYELQADDLVRSIQVLKMRGSFHETGRKRMRMEQGGLQVEPNRKPSPAATIPGKRAP